MYSLLFYHLSRVFNGRFMKIKRSSHLQVGSNMRDFLYFKTFEGHSLGTVTLTSIAVTEAGDSMFW